VAGSKSQSDGLTVLHVDGSASVRARAAAELDAEVRGVETATAARAALADGDFDCVVSEYALPDAPASEGDALALCEHVAAVAPDAAFVFYTDAGDESVAGRAFASGADGYVPKADGVDVLVERVLDVVDGVVAPVDGSPADPEAVLETRRSRSSRSPPTTSSCAGTPAPKRCSGTREPRPSARTCSTWSSPTRSARTPKPSANAHLPIQGRPRT
jgi:DNA-binding NarL/FixJ family response regulator